MANEKITGLKEAIENLNKLGKEVAERAKGSGLIAGARVLQAGMERRAPRRTGKLAGSIMIEIEGETAKIGPSADAWYGKFQEYGTTRQPAQPFARPTLDEDGNAAIKAVGDEIARVIK
ncbi:MAG: HK97-gp10 family putative phage morphogenesis protein [Eubacteriales bacterium]